MTSTPSLVSSVCTRSCPDLLEGTLEKVLLAGERHVDQFAQLAVLARAVAISHLSSDDHAIFLSAIANIASNARVDAQIDVELLQGLLAGQAMRRQLRAQLV